MNSFGKDQRFLTEVAFKKALNAISPVGASLDSIEPYGAKRDYTPKEREPHDALSDRFIRAVEISIRFMRSYERLLYAENSETLRDLLNRAERLDLISSVTLWLRMRDLRNRIVHDYTPEDIKQIYDSMMNEMGRELLTVAEKLESLNLEEDLY